MLFCGRKRLKDLPSHVSIGILSLHTPLTHSRRIATAVRRRPKQWHCGGRQKQRCICCHFEQFQRRTVGQQCSCLMSNRLCFIAFRSVSEVMPMFNMKENEPFVRCGGAWLRCRLLSLLHIAMRRRDNRPERLCVADHTHRLRHRQ